MGRRDALEGCGDTFGNGGDEARVRAPTVDDGPFDVITSCASEKLVETAASGATASRLFTYQLCRKVMDERDTYLYCGYCVNATALLTPSFLISSRHVSVIGLAYLTAT